MLHQKHLFPPHKAPIVSSDHIRNHRAKAPCTHILHTHHLICLFKRTSFSYGLCSSRDHPIEPVAYHLLVDIHVLYPRWLQGITKSAIYDSRVGLSRKGGKIDFRFVGLNWISSLFPSCPRDVYIWDRSACLFMCVRVVKNSWLAHSIYIAPWFMYVCDVFLLNHHNNASSLWICVGLIMAMMI